MASSLVVPVVEIRNVRQHPNASLLGLVDVLGYQMVVPLVEDPQGDIVRTFVKDKRDDKGRRVAYEPEADALVAGMATGGGLVKVEVEEVRFRHQYQEGQPVVYFPADTLIPAEWADRFGVRKYLKGKDNDRVGRIRLRGEPSFGLVVSLPIDNPPWLVGDNVAEYYGAKKYEPPIRATCGDAAERDPLIDPFFDKFTDVQNGRIFMDVFKEGEEVIFTEKIHGCFREDSMVMLSNGEERRISDIKEGMSILTMNEGNGATEVKKVLAVKVQKPEDSRWVRLVLENGREIVCTDEHLFLTKNRGYVKAIDLVDKDDIEEPTL